jgi:hypothetical protein
MKLTPEQQTQLAQSKAVGEKRVVLSHTPQQKEEWRATVQQELADKEENVDRFRKIKTAAEQVGFLGDLRRAIALSRSSVQELAAEIGVDWRLLSDFRAGEAELPSPALDRLVASLGLRLMQEIPR